MRRHITTDFERTLDASDQNLHFGVQTGRRTSGKPFDGRDAADYCPAC